MANASEETLRKTIAASTWEVIAKSDTGHDVRGLYDWIRFDTGGSAVPIAVKVTVRKSDGTTSDITRYVSAGEVWPGARIDRIWSTGTNAGVTADGWA